MNPIYNSSRMFRQNYLIAELELLANGGIVVLTKANSSRLHELISAAATSLPKIIGSPRFPVVGGDKLISSFKHMHNGLCSSQVVISNLDWRWLIDDVTKFKNAQLPFESVVFEMNINNCHCVVHMQQRHTSELTSESTSISAMVYTRLSDDQWIVIDPDDDLGHVYVAALTQAFGTITAMELEELTLLTQNQVPEKINKKRLKAGKEPLRDNYTLDLKPRHKSSSQEIISGYELKTRMRAHFRRGHWRKLNGRDECVWVRWCIAGDPELGFINKMYRL